MYGSFGVKQTPKPRERTSNPSVQDLIPARTDTCWSLSMIYEKEKRVNEIYSRIPYWETETLWLSECVQAWCRWVQLSAPVASHKWPWTEHRSHTWTWIFHGSSGKCFLPLTTYTHIYVHTHLISITEWKPTKWRKCALYHSAICTFMNATWVNWFL